MRRIAQNHEIVCQFGAARKILEVNNKQPTRQFSAEAPQQNTYKLQNVHQISENEMKTRGHSPIV